MEAIIESELTKDLTDAELELLVATYPNNPNMLKIAHDAQNIRAKIAIEAKMVAKFESEVIKLADKLPHPAHVLNLMFHWREVTELVDDTSKPKESVEIVDTAAVVDNVGTIVEPAVVHTEQRYPQLSVTTARYVATTNHTCRNVSPSAGQGDAKVGKRAITVLRRDNLTLVPQGNFKTARDACVKLSQGKANWVSNDSGTRELLANGYQTENYLGTDFTA